MKNNKTALISGGLGDIGNAIATLFGRNEIRVAIGDLKEEIDAKPQLEAMEQKGCKDLFYQKVDVTSEDDVINWIKAVENKWGTPQIIVPNAGIVVLGSLVTGNLSTSEIRKQIEVNFWGSYHVAVQSAKRMKAQSVPGRIVFIGSWVAERPDARIPSYCISKAGVRMLCKTMALELATDNILVNEIAPGIVAGGLSKKNQEKDPELLKRHLNSIPVHNLISVEEIAKQVLNMSSFDNMNMTGTTMLIDGGLSLTSKMSS